jgi:hypothetical protein
LATVLATIAEVAVFWWLLGRGLGLPVTRVFVPGRLWRIARLALVAGLAALGGRLAGRGPWEMILLGTLSHGAVFLLLAWRAGLGQFIKERRDRSRAIRGGGGVT